MRPTNLHRAALVAAASSTAVAAALALSPPTSASAHHSAPADLVRSEDNPSDVPPPSAVRLSDEILDDAAHAKITYEGSVNVASFQQDGLVTHGDHQYVAWYRADGRAVVSRRELPRGDWQSLELDAFLDANDSHNTISMAFSPSDERLHIALGTHGTPKLYVRSVPGLGEKGTNVPWSSTSFERVRRHLPGVSGVDATWTYPQFELHHGELLLTYREGSSNNGRQALVRYDDNADGTWSYEGLFTSGQGRYTSAFGTSNNRYGYLHGFAENPATGDLIITFSWREASSAWCSPSGLGNHDVGYAASSDDGATWHNNDGEQIGATGTGDLITIDDEHVVVPVDINRGMINQEAQTFDNAGRVHVMTSQFTDEDLAKMGGCHTSTYSQRAQYARPFHHWRDADGHWHTMLLPYYSGSAGRTKLLFDKHDTAYLVLPDGRIAAATAATEWSNWRIVFADPEVDPVAELIVDRDRLLDEGVLSVAYLQRSEDGAPSQFRVADFRTRPGHLPAPRATEPEAEPAPYAGSATTYPAATASSAQPNYPADNAVDGLAATFWVSGGGAEGDGPQPDRPETLTVELGRERPIGAVTVTPRVGFGPRALSIEARVDGEWRTFGPFTQADAAATHDVTDVVADALRLVIIAAYDRGRPPELARNVQVAEVAWE
jgi:hypothetical protein